MRPTAALLFIALCFELCMAMAPPVALSNNLEQRCCVSHASCTCDGVKRELQLEWNETFGTLMMRFASRGHPMHN
ncbi:hypothetical protein DL93DRAFT_2079256 [Clavulina sp. PMI_390]|nr:hypothetical protein DL93DRAFT_2079256 [Clavulina sp. PMI_390]